MAPVDRQPTAPDAARRDIFMDRVAVAAALAAHDQASRQALDRSLEALRAESARTLSFVRWQRQTQVYRRAVYKAAL